MEPNTTPNVHASAVSTAERDHELGTDPSSSAIVGDLARRLLRYGTGASLRADDSGVRKSSDRTCQSSQEVRALGAESDFGNLIRIAGKPRLVRGERR